MLVTYRRPMDLAAMLDRLREQTQAIEMLVVVDNSPEVANESSVAAFTSTLGRARYVAAPENGGPAGGIALGMSLVLEMARDDDWILLLDDNNPPEPQDQDVLERLLRFAEDTQRLIPATAGVGVCGSRFDRRTGLHVRPADEELNGAVRVDCFGGNQFPMYRASAVRQVGVFAAELFFGFEELEFGLRMCDAGFELYAHGEVWRELRERFGRTGLAVRPAFRVREPDWRSYYSLRNLVFILRAYGAPLAPLRVAFVAGVAKPILNLPLSPGRSTRQLVLNIRACQDAWMGRMGRRLEPQVCGRQDCIETGTVPFVQPD